MRLDHRGSTGITSLVGSRVLRAAWWPLAVGDKCSRFRIADHVEPGDLAPRVRALRLVPSPRRTSFSLMTYLDAQPRANAIKDAVLSRRMPPWGAVKGFGHFRNDQSLTQEQIELITKWVDGGIRRGNNPRLLPRDAVVRHAAAAPAAGRT